MTGAQRRHSAPLRPTPQFSFPLNGDRASGVLLRGCFVSCVLEVKDIAARAEAFLRKRHRCPFAAHLAVRLSPKVSGVACLGLFPAELFDALYVTGPVLSSAVYEVDRFDVSLG